MMPLSERILRFKQQSDEWFDAHIGRVSASDVHKCMAFSTRKGKEDQPLQPRIDYMAIKASELLTRLALHDNYVSRDMERGTELEPLARGKYEMATGFSVDEVGFVLHPEFPERCGASPDGLCGRDGGIEIKCPRASTHIKYLLADEVPEDYRPQMMLNIRCADAEWWDFVSYCPEMPAHLKLFIKRMPRHEEAIFEMDAQIKRFNAEVDALIDRLNKIAKPRRPAIVEQLEGSLTEVDIAWAIAQERGNA